MSTKIVYVAIGRRRDGEVTRYSSTNLSAAASAFHAYRGETGLFSSAELTEVTVIREERSRVLDSFERNCDE